MKKIAAVILLFFFVYPIFFKGIPVSTRIAFSILGLVFFYIDFIHKRTSLFLGYIPVLLVLLLIFLLSSLSVLINGTGDFEFIKYPVSIIAILVGANALIRIFSIMNIRCSFEFIAKLFVGVVFIQSIIALLMYAFPNFYDLMMSIQQLSIDEVVKMDSLAEIRVIGFGSQYFGAGIINGLALIILAYLIRIGEFDCAILKSAVVFLTIFIVGIGMARTTFIGFGLAAILLYPGDSMLKLKINYLKRSVLFFSSIIILIILGVISTFVFFPRLVSSSMPLINFALEMFLNYFNSGQLSTVSTSHLETMYIFPSRIDTYFIGDGLYTNADGLYYMGTDVGYLRLLFYFGVVGIILYIFLQYLLLRQSTQTIRHGRILFIFIFIYILILNLKGFADLASVTSLFFIVNLRHKHSY